MASKHETEEDIDDVEVEELSDFEDEIDIIGGAPDAAVADDDADSPLELGSWDEPEEKHSRAPRIFRYVKDGERKTSERLNDFEFARCVGDRASHIDNGAPTYVDTKTYTSSIAIAYVEIMQRLAPFIILRRVGEEVERWRLHEMTIGSVPTLEDMTR